MFLPACCPGRNTPWPGSGSPGHTLWCPPGPSSPDCSPLCLLQAGCSLTSSPLAERCTCHRGSTGSHSEGTFECSCTCLSSCFSLRRRGIEITKTAVEKVTTNVCWCGWFSVSQAKVVVTPYGLLWLLSRQGLDGTAVADPDDKLHWPNSFFQTALGLLSSDKSSIITHRSPCKDTFLLWQSIIRRWFPCK